MIGEGIKKITLKDVDYEHADYSNVEEMLSQFTEWQLDMDTSFSKLKEIRKEQKELIKDNIKFFTRDKNNLLVSNEKGQRKLLFFNIKTRYSDEELSGHLKEMYSGIKYLKDESEKAKKISYALMKMYIEYQKKYKEEEQSGVFDPALHAELGRKLPEIQRTMARYISTKEYFDKLSREMEMQIYGPEFEKITKMTYDKVVARIKDAREKLEKMKPNSLTDKIMANDLYERLARDEDYLDQYMKTMIYRNGNLKELSASAREDAEMRSYMFLLNLYNSSDKQVRRAFERSAAIDDKDTFAKVVFSMQHDLMKDFFFAGRIDKLQRMQPIEELAQIIELQLNVMSQKDNLNMFLTDGKQSLEVKRLENGNIEMTISSNSFDLPDISTGQSTEMSAVGASSFVHKIVYNEHTKKIESETRTFEKDAIQIKSKQKFNLEEIIKKKEKEFKRPLTEDEKKTLKEKETKMEKSMSSVWGKFTATFEKTGFLGIGLKAGLGIFSKDKTEKKSEKVDKHIKEETKTQSISIGSVELGASAKPLDIKVSAGATLLDGTATSEEKRIYDSERLGVTSMDTFTGEKTVVTKKKESNIKIGGEVTVDIDNILKKGKVITAEIGMEGSITFRFTDAENRMFESKTDASVKISDDVIRQILSLKGAPVSFSDLEIKAPELYKVIPGLEEFKPIGTILLGDQDKIQENAKTAATELIDKVKENTSLNGVREQIDTYRQGETQPLSEDVKDQLDQDNEEVALYSISNSEVSKAIENEKRKFLIEKLEKVKKQKQRISAAKDEDKEYKKHGKKKGPRSKAEHKKKQEKIKRQTEIIVGNFGLNDAAFEKAPFEDKLQMVELIKEDIKTIGDYLAIVKEPEEYYSKMLSVSHRQSIKKDVRDGIWNVYENRMKERFKELITERNGKLLEHLSKNHITMLREAIQEIKKDSIDNKELLENLSIAISKMEKPEVFIQNIKDHTLDELIQNASQSNDRDTNRTNQLSRSEQNER